MKYAITAATGNFGKIAVKKLANLVGQDNVIVIARNEEKATQMFPGFEVRQAAYDEVDPLAQALTGADRVLFISSQPGQAIPRSQQHENVVTALKQAGVSYVAYTGFAHAQESPNALANDHQLTEKLLAESGLNYSILRNNWYLENEIDFLQAGSEGKRITYWASDKAGWALEREYAEAAVKVLVSENPKQIYEFAGPIRSYAQLAQALQEATGKEFDMAHLTEAAYVDDLVASGLDQATAELFASFQAPIADGSLNHPENDLEEVLGHPVTDLVEAIKEVLA